MPTIEADLRLRATSEPAEPGEVAPYDESLYVQEFEVVKVRTGQLEAPVIRIARWAVLGGEDVAPEPRPPGTVETLRFVSFDRLGEEMGSLDTRDHLPHDLSVPLFLEEPGFDSLEEGDIPESLRFDYRSRFSERMRLFWLLRRQLEVVVIGNSHGEVGVDARAFYPDRNALTPVALNFCKAAADFPQLELLVTEYVDRLPALRWLIWCLSPRLLNQRRRSPWRLKEFTASPGFRFDQANGDELWPAGAGERVALAEATALTGQFDAWGGTGHRGTSLPADPAARRRAVNEEVKDRHFSWDNAAAESIRQTTQAFAGRGVKTCFLIPAYHPDLAGSGAADIDGTGLRDAARVREFLLALTTRNPGAVAVADVHNGGASGFPPEAFWDADHLNRDGRGLQTTRLLAAMAPLDPELAPWKP
jgi:hypothetical protein